MKSINLTDTDIEAAFKRTNFGRSGATDIGRRGLMVECILKRASGYHDGSTIVRICIELGLLRNNSLATKTSIRWAFEQLYFSGGEGPTMLERIKGNEAI